jgi:hypothetical protein
MGIPLGKKYLRKVRILHAGAQTSLDTILSAIRPHLPPYDKIVTLHPIQRVGVKYFDTF